MFFKEIYLSPKTRLTNKFFRGRAALKRSTTNKFVPEVSVCSVRANQAENLLTAHLPSSLAKLGNVGCGEVVDTDHSIRALSFVPGAEPLPTQSFGMTSRA